MQLAPPVMPAQLIQALYNIVDILFVGRYSASGLTALSIIYPVQLPMIALTLICTLVLFEPWAICFPGGPARLLADLPGDGDPYLPAERRLLPGLPETSYV